MNAERRKKLDAIKDRIVGLQAELEEIESEECAAFDAMPEGLQEGEAGQKSSEASENIGDAISHLEEAEAAIELACA